MDEKRFYKSQIKLSSTVEDEVADLLAKNGGPGLHEFDKNSIFVIYIGVNSSADFESKIREMAGAHEIHVERLKKRSNLIFLILAYCPARSS